MANDPRKQQGEERTEPKSGRQEKGMGQTQKDGAGSRKAAPRDGSSRTSPSGSGPKPNKPSVEADVDSDDFDEENKEI